MFNLDNYFATADEGADRASKLARGLGTAIEWVITGALLSVLMFISFPFWVIGKICGLCAKSDL